MVQQAPGLSEVVDYYLLIRHIWSTASLSFIKSVLSILCQKIDKSVGKLTDKTLAQFCRNSKTPTVTKKVFH